MCDLSNSSQSTKGKQNNKKVAVKLINHHEIKITFFSSLYYKNHTKKQMVSTTGLV